MASTNGDDVLQTSPERENFYRLTTLLIAGGTDIMRQVLDRKIRPQTLANVLASSRSNLRRLLRPQMNLLFPPPGTPVNSRKFDITLLFALLRSICGLKEPLNGWDQLPDGDDESLEADLARIKYYRNEIYAHANEMEIGADEFETLWKNISESLLRIIGLMDVHKMVKFKMAVTSFKTGPLESAEKLDSEVAKLREWYLEELREEQVRRSMINLEQTTIEENRKTRDVVTKATESILQAFSEKPAAHSAATHVYHGPVNIVNNSYNICDASPRIQELFASSQSQRGGSNALSMERGSMATVTAIQSSASHDRPQPTEPLPHHGHSDKGMSYTRSMLNASSESSGLNNPGKSCAADGHGNESHTTEGADTGVSRKLHPSASCPSLLSGESDRELRKVQKLYSIVCQQGGSVKLESFRQLLAKECAIVEEIGVQNFFKNNEDYFKLQRNEEAVHAIIPADFCSVIHNGSCTTRCSNLHVCPLYLLGQCSRKDLGCQRSHDHTDPHTQHIFRNVLELDDLTSTQQLSLLKKIAQEKMPDYVKPCTSVPKVCIHYNNRGCRNGVECPFLHVCFYWAKKFCKSRNNCTRAHDFTSNANNQKVLEKHNLHDLSESVIQKLLRKKQ